MTIILDEDAVRERLRPVIETPEYALGLQNLTNYRLMLAIFLMGAAEGERLGEAGVAAIRQEELARLIHNLRQQELEEHGHGESARMLAEEFFPEYFADDGSFLYDHVRTGAPYYLKVREINRARLKERGVYSRLNMYMTTSFGYEIMVQLLYGSLIEAVQRSTLPKDIVGRVEFVLTAILAQEETHLEMVGQHNTLLEADRSTLSPEACEALDMLGKLTAEDYEWIADVAVQEIVPTIVRYADADAFHAMADAGAPAER